MNQVSNHPYGRERPMFDDVRRMDDHYLTQNPQFGYGGSQGGYAGGFGGAGGKQGMYHQGYGMSPQTAYDNHSASPANAGAFGQNSNTGRDSGAPGLGNYGRSGSAQPSDNQQFPSASNHGNVPDAFARSQSGYPGQNSGLSHMGQEDSLRGYGDSKVPGGPSPALGQPGRPGSAATPQAQSGLPPPHGQSQGQQGYSGYMGQMHGQGGSQYGAPGGLGGHHQYGGHNQQGGSYGGYGAGYGSSSYGNSNRGGWGGASYGH